MEAHRLEEAPEELHDLHRTRSPPLSAAGGRPDWQAWTEEPWSASSNGTIHASGFYIGEVDEPSKVDKAYASELDVANARRIASCVNALAGVAGVSAVPRALELVEELGGIVESLGDVVDVRERPELAGRIAQALEWLKAVRSELATPPDA